MAHFAQLDENNMVIQVVVVSNGDCRGATGEESEAVGIAFCRSLFGEDTRWKQTSYSGSIRRRFAGVDFIYDETLDAFVAPQPFSSWTFNRETADWDSPVPRPERGFWQWNEKMQKWEEYESLPQGGMQ